MERRRKVNQINYLAVQYNILQFPTKVKELNAKCPVAQVNSSFSPEKITSIVGSVPEEIIKSPLIWECLTCGLCKEASGGIVNMSSFIKEVRRLARQNGYEGTETHGGIFLTAQRMSAKSELKPTSTTPWIDESLEVEYDSGEYLFWPGPTQFFNTLLPELSTEAINSTNAAIRLLNSVGIKPVVLKDVKFSGFDLLNTGDAENFKELSKINIESIKNSGAKKVIVAYPEDYYTLALSYKEYFGDLGFEVCHITELLQDYLTKLKFKGLEKRITYQDPCHLGRGMGVYDAPRKILNAIPGIQLIEMKNSKESSLCCGTSCWTNCNKYSKLMQVNRLREAVSTGAETLITACPECSIHFFCTLQSSAWQQITLEVKDILVFAASLLQD